MFSVDFDQQQENNMEDAERKAYQKVIEILASGEPINYRAMCLELAMSTPLTFMALKESVPAPTEGNSLSKLDSAVLHLIRLNRHTEAIRMMTNAGGMNSTEAAAYCNDLLDRAKAKTAARKPVMVLNDVELLIRDLMAAEDGSVKARTSTPTTTGDQVW